MSDLKKILKLAVLFVLVSGLVFSVLSCRKTGEQTVQRTVTVSGKGTVNLKADIVTFSIQISETADRTSDAQQMTNAKIASVLAILRSYGIEDSQITTASLNFQTVYRWVDGEQIKTGEQVSQTLTVRLENIDSFASVVDSLGSGVSGLSLYNVSFLASDYSDAALKARELAYRNAEEKARVYAGSCGLELGAPVSISDYNDTYGTVRNYMEEAKVEMATGDSAFFRTETPTGLLSVSVNANVVFELK